MSDQTNKGPLSSLAQHHQEQEQEIQRSSELMAKLFAYQAEEARIKGEEVRLKEMELELVKQKDSHGFQLSQTVWQLQAQDRKHERELEASSKDDLRRLVFRMALLFVVLVGVALFLNHDDVAKEVIKAVAYVVSGLLGGFGIAKARTTERDIKNTTSVHKG